MLRLSILEAAGDTVTIRIDGQISSEWVKLLQKTCETHLEKGLRVSIDLRNVSFVDRDGVAMLRKLTGYKVEFLNASPFIADLIRNQEYR